MIYLDNAATTFPKPEEVYQTVDSANRSMAFNAGRGSYDESKNAFNLIENARQALGDLVGTAGDRVVFSSSATEALNQIILGLGFSSGETVYISPFEHNAIVRPLWRLKKTIGINIEVLPFDEHTWKPDLEAIRNLFALKRPVAVFLSHISNVTGYILPFKEIFEEAKKYGSTNVLDCAQSLGVLNPDTKFVDFLVFAGHKSLYATFGVAGFICLGKTKLAIVKCGGTGSDSLNPEMPESVPGRLEAGSMNVVAIAGLLAALEWRKKNDVVGHEKEITAYLVEKLQTNPKVHMYLPADRDRTLGIVSFNVDGYLPNEVGEILDAEYNISVRTGYHCAPFVHRFIKSEDLSGTVRASISAFTERSDIDLLISALSTF